LEMAATRVVTGTNHWTVVGDMSGKTFLLLLTVILCARA